jgi:hypothetical protein
VVSLVKNAIAVRRVFGKIIGEKNAGNLNNRNSF